MGESLRARLIALERDHTAVRLRSGVITFGRNETPDAALERARREGITGPVLLVPEVMTHEEWAEMMANEANRDQHEK